MILGSCRFSPERKNLTVAEPESFRHTTCRFEELRLCEPGKERGLVQGAEMRTPHLVFRLRVGGHIRREGRATEITKE